MIHAVPGNRLESLAEVLSVLVAIPGMSPLEPERILVQHQGMQHWLGMKLAEHPDRGIAMNFSFPLPVRYMWSLIRTILGEDTVPDTSPYQREILVWRLYELLGSPEVTEARDCIEPTRYWQRQSERQQAARRYLLAGELADLYEQYLMFRPDWIEAWDQGRLGDREPGAGGPPHWQARVWRLLTAAEPDHPIMLLNRARVRLQQPVEGLPPRFFIFGINTLAPIWLDFLKELSDSQGVDIHILYLTPTNEYWQDASSEKQVARQRARWLDSHEDDDGFIAEIGNPLVTSLGVQGQQFVRLLSERADMETPAFEQPGHEHLLAQLQRDMLHFVDGRERPSSQCDGSITVVSAHSALREVQGLHDWLLHRFNEDPALTPKEVVVLCPNVEHYAPFVESVFAGRYEELREEVPPLPCSIADRNPGDADPSIAMFLDLLALPDARFQVSQVLSWLQVPAVQQRFDISVDDLEVVGGWLDAAAIHWGLNAQHRRQWVAGQESASFTWSQGLERLLLGFAWGDREAIVNGKLLLPQVEGADALLLGRVIAFVRTLERLLGDMRTSRNLTEWQQFLHERLRLALLADDRLFEGVHGDLIDAIGELGEHGRVAGFVEAVPLPVVRRALQNSLGTPARTGRQFMTGQITVCSMVPMRSIPFRIVALLGLNDGEFPRHRPPLGFDRMSNDQPRAGDRSRRGDDRYLFLEALLSARDFLYLSFQGRDVRTNSEKQPSLVLAELLDYLASASGWRRTSVRELPLQPFSSDNFRGADKTFDRHWLRLARPLAPLKRLRTLPDPLEWPPVLPLTALIRAVEHPARYFAEQRLRLFLGRDQRVQLSDSEPFVTSHLDRYRIQEEVIDGSWGRDGVDLDEIIMRARLSGHLPEHSLVDDEIEGWKAQAEQFAQHLNDRWGIPERRPLRLSIADIDIEAEIPLVDEGHLLFARMANPKARDYLNLWFHHLLANAHFPAACVGYYRGKKEQADQVLELSFPELDPETAKKHLRDWLEFWRRSLREPLPLHGRLGIQAGRSDFEGHLFQKEWQGDDYRNDGLQQDPYLSWFWPTPPDAGWVAEQLRPLYAPMLEQLSEKVVAAEVQR